MKKRLANYKTALLTFVLAFILISGGLNVHASTAYTGMRSDITALQIVSEMQVGWNLGNTMDTGGAETAWGNPVTTHAMIDKIKQQGFNTLRIPTTWNNHVGGAPNYTIDPAFLDRVEQIANYAFDNNMYVIINTHHEGSWARPTYAALSAVKAELTAIWTQVANRFKNYGDYLIFETLNEPRLEGSPEEWTGGTAEGRDCVNQENLAAVNAIRATGGNNSTRFIMCPTYAAAGYQSTIDAFIVPNNDSRIIVSIHNYSPYTFAMEYPGVSTWGTDADKTSLNAEFDTLYNKFVGNGRAVVIGESGTTNKNNLSARVAHAEYFYSALRARRITGIWWDNNGSAVGGENFGIFNRSALNWYFPDIANAVIRGAGGSVNTPTPTPTVTSTPTPTGTVTPTPTASQNPDGCSISYSQNDWGSGATVSVTIKNNGAAALNGWTLAWNFAGNQTITNMWNATYTQSGAAVTVKNVSYNSVIPAKESVTFGFNITYSGANTKPDAFTLNGTVCPLD
jgi:endoglucanase